MRRRITRNDLQAVIDRLNTVTDSPMTPYRRDADGVRHVANVGNYHLSGAYGGWCVHRMTNEGGGVTTPISYGHIPARELYELLHAYLRGFDAGRTSR